MARKLAGVFLFAIMCASSAMLFAQGAKLRQEPDESGEMERDRPLDREQWFHQGRALANGSPAEMLHKAFQAKMQQRAITMRKSSVRTRTATTVAGGADRSTLWTPMGPAPIVSDSTGAQDYGPITGRATAVAVDQSDTTGNTVYLGGAYGGLWKSSNAAATDPTSVIWTPLLDQQATLAVGAVAVHPTNGNILLVGTGEANNAIDSYYGFGIYRSTDGGANWTLITATKNNQSFRGLAFSRIAWSRTDPNIVVAAASGSSLGSSYGAVGSSLRGLYYSLDAGATWERAAITDPGFGAPDAASVSSVHWNAADRKFYAVLRYHGLYASAGDDPASFSRIANQPAGLTSANCPLWAPASGSLCPVFRGELASHPKRNELYFWFVDGNNVNRGVWKSTDSGATWTLLNTAAMTNCGDSGGGCGTEQAFYNMALIAIPNPTDASATDLYAGAVNVFKCTINAANPTCSGASDPYRFMNVTHVYGCSPMGVSSHVHPDEHDFAFPLTRTNIVYFANDGGIYRTLNASGLNAGGCSHMPFDNLNTNMGSMTQFVWATPHPTDDSSILGGTQDTGSPAVNGSMMGAYGQQWHSVNNGDGGFTAILPNSPGTWLTENNDVSVQVCTSGINCAPGRWTTLVNNAGVGGDQGAFYAPFMLDPQNPARLIVGTCRVHRGNSTGSFNGTALSNNFWTSSAAKCVYGTHPMISALGAGGPTSPNGSQVIYAGNESGQIFVTMNADAGNTSWVERTPAMSLNPGAAAVGWRFRISSIAVDLNDSTGRTAYAAIQGFGSAHVIKTTDGGATWTNITAGLPDSPANNIAIDPDDASTLYVATDVGVFVTSGSGWVEVGPDPAAEAYGYLPNVVVMRVAVSKANGRKLLIAATYGRGVWKADLSALGANAFVTLMPPSSNEMTIKTGQVASFDLGVINQGGFADTVVFTCSTSSTSASCVVSPGTLALNGNSGNVRVTVSTSVASQPQRASATRGFPGLALVLPGIVFFGAMRCPRRLAAYTLLAYLLAGSLAMTSCGGGGGNVNANTVVAAGGGSPANSAKQVTVKVTATCASKTTSVDTFFWVE